MGRDNFTEEFKHDAAPQIVKRSYPIAEVSQRLGVSRRSLNGRAGFTFARFTVERFLIQRNATNRHRSERSSHQTHASVVVNRFWTLFPFICWNARYYSALTVSPINDIFYSIVN